MHDPYDRAGFEAPRPRPTEARGPCGHAEPRLAIWDEARRSGWLAPGAYERERVIEAAVLASLG